MPRRRKSARNKVLVSTDEEEKSEEEEETVNLKSNTKRHKKKVPVSDSEESEEWLPTVDVEVDNESDSESNVGEEEEEEDSESVVPETPQKRSTRQNKEKLFQLSSVTTHTDSTDKKNNQPKPLTLRSPPTRHSLEHHTLSPQCNTRKPNNKTKTQESKQQDSPPTPRGEEAAGTDTNTMTVITRSRREVLQVTDNITSSNTTTTASTERTSRTSAITNSPLSAAVTDDAAGVVGDVNRPRDPPPPSRHPRTHKSGRTLPKPPAVNQSG